jgi:hypothetical protein
MQDEQEAAGEDQHAHNAAKRDKQLFPFPHIYILPPAVWKDRAN